MNFDQRALRFCCAGSCLVGIIDVPERPIERGLLVVTDAAQYRVGGHRQFALLSRTLAGRGIPVMRFDHRGCGDSEGDPRPFDAIGEDIRTAIGEFFMQMPDLKEIVIWGIGHAAAAAALYAHLDPCVRGLVLLNPWTGSPVDAPRAGVRQFYLGRLGELGFWKKVAGGVAEPASGDVALRQHLRETASDSTLALPQRFVASLACFSGEVLAVTGGADPAAQDFNRLADKHEIRCRRVDIADAGHTFARRDWRDEIASLTAHWLVTW